MDNNSKKVIEIQPLPTIDNVLNRLSFLKYSTQLRNLAYQIQLYEFLKALHKNYKIDRGLEKIFILQTCFITSNIIEHLLFCCFKMMDNNLQGRHKKATALNNMVKKRGIYNKRLYLKLKRFIDIRNDLHPEKQMDLHIKKVDKEDLTQSISVINELGVRIKKY